jgi:hypothetical protein
VSTDGLHADVPISRAWWRSSGDVLCVRSVWEAKIQSADRARRASHSSVALLTIARALSRHLAAFVMIDLSRSTTDERRVTTSCSSTPPDASY